MSAFDFAIIGGGMAGISAAARLVTLGSVLVLEREETLGYHATGRSSALYEPNYGNKYILEVTRAGLSGFQNPLGCDESVLSPRGVLMVATAEELAHRKGDVLEDWREIDLDEALSIVPLLRREKVAKAWHSGAAQDIDVDRLLQGFARAARGAGAQIQFSADVQALSKTANGWRIATSAGEYGAAVVINAAGAWADPIAQLAGLAPLGVQPMRRTMAVVPGPEGVAFENWPMMFSMSENWYAKPDSGKLFVSPADEEPVAPMDAWPEDLAIATGIDRFTQMVDLDVTRVEHSWAGLRSFAPDRTPVVGMDPDATGFFWLAGQGGYGIQTAPVLSRLVCEMLGGEEVGLEPWVVSGLSPKRFRVA